MSTSILVEVESPSRALSDAPEMKLSSFTAEVWESDDDMVRLRSHITDHMRAIWDKAIDSFIQGNWVVSKDYIQQFLKMAENNDGPANLMLEYMDKYNSNPPIDWKGYRKLF